MGNSTSSRAKTTSAATAEAAPGLKVSSKKSIAGARGRKVTSPTKPRKQRKSSEADVPSSQAVEPLSEEPVLVSRGIDNTTEEIVIEDDVTYETDEESDDDEEQDEGKFGLVAPG